MTKSLFAVVVLGGCLVGGCQTSKPAASSREVVEAATPAMTQSTIDRIKGMAGTWNLKDEKGESKGQSIFTVSGGGSNVREVMFPGSAHEMTNMYHLDGRSIVCAHYCASGNQPHLRSHGAEGDTIKFTMDSVSNFRSADEQYMGEMWLTFKDRDVVDQRWKSFKDGVVVEDFTFTMTKVK